LPRAQRLCYTFVALRVQGSLVRVVRREEELLRQLVAATRAVGEEGLAAKFEDGIARIKRDIIFAASLYL
jgi:ATP-dependent RNA helicase DOB1